MVHVQYFTYYLVYIFTVSSIAQLTWTLSLRCWPLAGMCCWYHCWNSSKGKPSNNSICKWNTIYNYILQFDINSHYIFLLNQMLIKCFWKMLLSYSTIMFNNMHILFTCFFNLSKVYVAPVISFQYRFTSSPMLVSSHFFRVIKDWT